MPRFQGISPLWCGLMWYNGSILGSWNSHWSSTKLDMFHADSAPASTLGGPNTGQTPNKPRSCEELWTKKRCGPRMANAIRVWTLDIIYKTYVYIYICIYIYIFIDILSTGQNIHSVNTFFLNDSARMNAVQWNAIYVFMLWYWFDYCKYCRFVLWTPHAQWVHKLYIYIYMFF